LQVLIIGEVRKQADSPEACGHASL